MLGKMQLPDNLVIRPAREEDNIFLESLFRSTRDDLWLIDAERDFVEELIAMQHRAQVQGYSDAYPNAFYFVVEKLGDKIGRIAVDFGHNEVHIIDIAFIPEARGKGFGSSVIKVLQYAATQVRAPLTLSVHQNNIPAKRFYLSLGFALEPDHHPVAERMVWYPLPGAV